MSSAYDKFISGESLDQAILIGRPTHGDIARVITALYGVDVCLLREIAPFPDRIVLTDE
jgi:methyl coenzyme M reductase gamma subunit